ncbi:iron donor protein CyaY [Motiliproteus sediminis]|uniref:iron donor protein CyaY n=1 Tax=Motiliproteus sediminis TaxID=1468178 RepID=UPI001FE4FD4F|nr:iron donor protein CyaY [Motiliproteus sediminis]
MISESEFNSRVDDTLLAIEEVLDGADSDIDYENSGGVLTVTCENGSKVIFTRQGPVRQLWVATPFGGFHFDQQGGRWVRDSDAQPLAEFLAATFSQCAGEQFDFS